MVLPADSCILDFDGHLARFERGAIKHMFDVWFCWATPEVMIWVRVDTNVGFHVRSVSVAHRAIGLSVQWALI